MGILSKLFNSAPHKWILYNNSKQYGDYGVTPMPTAQNIAPLCTKANVLNYLKQYNDSIKIIGTTKKTDVYFYRYDFAIKRAIALIHMKKRIRMTGDDPVQLADSLIEHKQEFTRQFIDRANADITEKINKLKTVASKQKNIDAFENSFKPFYDEISPENADYIQQIVTRLRQSLKK